MNPYNFALLFFSFCTFLISVMIWFKRRDQISRIYFAFSAFVTIWSTSWSVVISDNASYNVALLCSRLTHGSAGLIAVTWFHFALVFTDNLAKHKKLLIGFYIFSFVILCFIFTPWFVPEVVPAVGFKHYTRSGPLLDAYIIMFFAGVILGFVQLYNEIKRSVGEKKLQLQGLFVATLIGFLGGTSILLPMYGIMLPQYNLFMVPVYPFVMAYFIMRHRLFDVEQIVQAFQREKLVTIGLLAASINHEIRNPLYAVKSLLETYIDDDESGRQRKTPNEISKKALAQVSRALDVITKLNRFAKPATDSIAQDSKASIQEALQNVLDLVSYEFELDKIHIKDNLSKDLPPIQADQRQIEEILFNLIVNACHAMKERQKTKDYRPETQAVLTLNSKLSTKNHGGSAAYFGGETQNIVIEIQDTGTGIPLEQAKHLFEPFHTTKGDKGTGLGLYITKQLVERNGGKITVKTVEGHGTTFVLEFKALKELE